MTPDQVWAANGSNEVMLHLLQAFGGPGRTAVSFAPTYSMYPEYARDTDTALGRRAARRRLRARPRRRPRARRGASGPASCCCRRPNNPTGTALPLATVEALCEAAESGGDGLVVVDEAYGEFRRTGTPSALELLPSLPQPGRVAGP